MTRARFERLVEEALGSIPEQFRQALDNVAILIEDEPSSELLASMAVEPPDTLLGLYEGVPLTEREWSEGPLLPDRVTLFQGPITREGRDEAGIVLEVGDTLIHELGHYFGLDEEEIQDIEQRYWRDATRD